MPTPTMTRRAVALGAVLLLAACQAPNGSRTEGSGAPGAVGGVASPIASGSTSDAEAYCTGHGGHLVDRVATWNTNEDPAAQLQLAGRWTLCEFESSGDSPTRISVDLTTLSSTQ